MRLFLALCISLSLYANEAFISATQLASILEDKNLVLLDVDDAKYYKKGHIVGALHFEVAKLYEKDLHNLKENMALYELFLEYGIGKESRVVLYSHNTKEGFYNASFVAFALAKVGFENFSILDGGYRSWVFEYELLCEKKSNDATRAITPFMLHPKELVASWDDLLESKTLLDSRSLFEYYGVDDSYALALRGHIPHAKSSFADLKFAHDGRLREMREVEAMYSAVGIDAKSSGVVVYGDSLQEATMEWYLVKRIMHIENVKIFTGGVATYVKKAQKQLVRYTWE